MDRLKRRGTLAFSGSTYDIPFRRFTLYYLIMCRQLGRLYQQPLLRRVTARTRLQRRDAVEVGGRQRVRISQCVER